MTPAAMLRELERWRDAGWLRRLDAALARFVHELDPEAPASLLLAAALVAQLEGRGHSALPLAELWTDPQGFLGWPEEGIDALRRAWSAAAGQAAGGCAGAPGEGAGPPAGWQGRPVLQIDPGDDTGAAPLVWRGGMLYLRRYWRYEARVAAQIHARSDQMPAGAEPAAQADPEAARAILERLFGAAKAAATPGGAGSEIDWQKVACALALRGRLTLITGGPGTGKTHTAARLLVLLQALHTGPQPLRVALAAPTGKAAARLRQSIQRALHALRGEIGAWVTAADAVAPARTLHALLGTQPGTRRFRHDAANPLAVDLLFVDEASMVHLEMMAQLLEALPPDARLILLGDKDQLASVEAGAVMGDLCQGADGRADGNGGGGYRPDTAAWIAAVTGQALPQSALGEGSALAQQTVVLRKSHRFDGPIGQLAQAVNTGDAAAAIAMLQARSDGPLALRAAADAGAVSRLAAEGYRGFLELVAQRPAEAAAFPDWARSVLRRFDRFRVLCALREGPWGVAGLNAVIERALGDAGLLVRRGEAYEGRPVMVTRNDPALGVFNGDVGVVLRGPAGDSGLRAYFLAGEELHSVSVSRLSDVETAFAMTVHKSQGSEFAHVLLVLPDEDAPVLTRELVYTGITRAGEAFTLLSPRPQGLAQALARRSLRASGLAQRLRAPAD